MVISPSILTAAKENVSLARFYSVVVMWNVDIAVFNDDVLSSCYVQMLAIMYASSPESLP